jgi:hypothetical protein
VPEQLHLRLFEFDPAEVESVAMCWCDVPLYEHHLIRRRLASVGIEVRRIEFWGSPYVWVVKGRTATHLYNEEARHLSRQARAVLRDLGHDVGRGEPAVAWTNSARYGTYVTLAFASKKHARPGLLRVDRRTDQEVHEPWAWQGHVLEGGVV